MLKGLLDSFSIMSNVLKEALQSEKSMNIFLRRFSNSIKITNNTTREVELSSGLKSLIEFNEDPSKKNNNKNHRLKKWQGNKSCTIGECRPHINGHRRRTADPY